MKEKMESLCVAIRHNQGLTYGMVAVIFLLVWLGGCESTVKSITTPGKKVTRSELQLEVAQEKARIQQDVTQEIAELNRQIDIIAAKSQASLETLGLDAELKEKRLDQQDMIKQKAAEIGLAVAQGGTINPVGVAVTAMGILGIGAVVDNRKKDGLLTPNPATKKS